jgi:multicomponent Na+:H+ antiporter subunit C
MTLMDLFMAAGIAVLFATGIYQLLRRNVVRSVLGMVIISNAINLFLLAIGAYDGTIQSYAKASGIRSDALPLALILTAIVISMGGFAFTLATIAILLKRQKSTDLDSYRELKH